MKDHQATIKETRLSLGMTQAQAAALIGAKRRSWQCWELGTRNMPPAKYALFKIMVAKKKAGKA